VALMALGSISTAADPRTALHMAWMRMRGGEHERDLRPTSVLDVVMVV
jgi:hypothetical protein